MWDETGKFPHSKGPRPDHRGVDGLGQFDWGATIEDDDAFGDTQAADWVAEKLSSGVAGDKPFFIGLGIYRPHVPWYVPKKYFDQFPLDAIQLPEVKSDDLADLPPGAMRILEDKSHHQKIIEQKKWAEGIRAYLACVSYADGLVGRVLDGLDAGPYANGDQELYDHRIDPLEWNNLAGDGQHESIMKELASHLPRNLASKEATP